MSDIKNTETENGFTSDVKIADEVIMSIAALAATDVEGVASMAGNVTNDIIKKLGVHNLKKGVKIVMEGETLKVSVALIIKYGYNIPEICKSVQDKIKSAVENMTGFTVTEVNVSIAGIETEEEKN